MFNNKISQSIKNNNNHNNNNIIIVLLLTIVSCIKIRFNTNIRVLISCKWLIFTYL